MIPSDFITELLSRVDIVDVIGRYLPLKKKGRDFWANCPFHNEKTGSFSVSQGKQFYKCFGCGEHGNAIGFVMKFKGIPYPEAVREVAALAGMVVPEDRNPRHVEAEKKRRTLSGVMQHAAEFYAEKLRQSRTASDYIHGRGLTDETIARFALGYSPDAWQGLEGCFDDYSDPALERCALVKVLDTGRRYDAFRNRIMFPIRSQKGDVIAFGARVLGAGEPKYLNSPETEIYHKSHELYGLFEARDAIHRKGRVIVVEGYMDVISLSQAGFGETVAACGTSITPEHVSRLFKMADNVIFSFDGDPAGLKAARRALESALAQIRDGQTARFVLLGDPGKAEKVDPDSLVKEHGPQAYEAEIAKSKPLSQFFMADLTRGLDMSIPESRAAVLAQARPLILSMQAPGLRLQLLQALASSTRSDLASVLQMYGLAAPAPMPAPPARFAQKRPQRAARPPVHRIIIKDLRKRALQALLAQPMLAFEFGGMIGEMAGSEEPTEQAIVAVWQAALACDPQVRPNTAAILSALPEGPVSELCTALAEDEMQMDTDLAQARSQIQGAFRRIEYESVSASLEALVASSDIDLEKYRYLDLRRRRLREEIAQSEIADAQTPGA